LREILRDRRTIITLVLMPLLLYPLLSLAFQKLLLTGLAGKQQLRLRIGIEADQKDVILELLRLGTRALAQADAPGAEEKDSSPEIECVFPQNVEVEVLKLAIDLGIRVRGDKPPSLNPRRRVEVDLELVSLEGLSAAKPATEYAEKCLGAASE